MKSQYTDLTSRFGAKGRVSHITLINIRGAEQCFLFLVRHGHGHVWGITRLNEVTAERHKDKTTICNTRTSMYHKSVQIQLHFLKQTLSTVSYASLFKRSTEMLRFPTWSFSSAGSCCTGCWTCPCWKRLLRTCKSALCCSSGNSEGLHSSRIERSGKWDLLSKWPCQYCNLIFVYSSCTVSVVKVMTEQEQLFIVWFLYLCQCRLPAGSQCWCDVQYMLTSSVQTSRLLSPLLGACLHITHHRKALCNFVN